jgi:hypothetical protein
MNLRGRLNRVTKRLGANHPVGPLTVVLIDATDGLPPGRCERTNSAGLPVLEIAFDPAGGPVELPAGPFKLVCGLDPVDLV